MDHAVSTHIIFGLVWVGVAYPTVYRRCKNDSVNGEDRDILEDPFFAAIATLLTLLVFNGLAVFWASVFWIIFNLPMGIVAHILGLVVNLALFYAILELPKDSKRFHPLYALAALTQFVALYGLTIAASNPQTTVTLVAQWITSIRG